MINAITGKYSKATTRNNDIFLALAVVSMTMLLVIPLSPMMLDVLISISIVLGVTTLLVTLYTEDSLAFSSFPSLLLILTLFRLGLNIASSRMILTEGQAGLIIKTFGEFVTGGNQFVGFLIFLLLTGFNFIVITKGSGRVAEVAARFTLDSLPGKQLAIDADVNAGLINENEAQKRREKVIGESDFYGAMDGASKFVRGDAIAGMVIIIVNTIGSFVMGMGMRGLSWDEVVRVYMTLTVGDGLVTQIPALLISVGAGIIVTRSSSKQHLGDLFRQQLFNNPKVLILSAFMLAMLSLIPGMPKIVMLTIAATIFLYARVLRQGQTKVSLSEDETQADQEDLVKDPIGQVTKILTVETLELELGEKLSPLIQEGAQEKSLMNRISAIRQQIAYDLGIVVPVIKIRTSPFLPPDSYLIKIKGNEIESGTLHLGLYLAMNPGFVQHQMEGIQTIEPVFKLPATWITAEQKQEAETLGYTLAEPLTVLSTHLAEVIHSHAHELLNRQDVARLVEGTRTYASAVIDELIPNRLSLGQILKVLQGLIKERVSIRDFVTILEILADHSPAVKEIETLTEYVRIGLSRGISKQYVDQNKTLYAITFDTKVEQMLLEAIQKSELGKQIVLHPGSSQSVREAVKTFSAASTSQGRRAVLLTSSALRPYVRKFIEKGLPSLPVLAFNEIIRDVQIVSVGTVSQEALM